MATRDVRVEQERVEAIHQAVNRFQAVAPVKPGMVGMMLRRDEERVKIGGVAENSPAGRAGLKAGDGLLAVNGTNISSMSFNEMMQMITGDEGTQVVLEIDDGQPNGRRNVVLTREKVNLSEIREPASPNVVN